MRFSDSRETPALDHTSGFATGCLKGVPWLCLLPLERCYLPALVRRADLGGTNGELSADIWLAANDLNEKVDHTLRQYEKSSGRLTPCDSRIGLPVVFNVR